jgi:anti-sigma factor RsiW
MKPLDHETYREWLHLECDGELPSADRSRLRQHLDSCAECRAESQELVAFDKLLTESRIPVHRSFHDDVMSELPTAGWESSHPRSWVAALVVAALLGIAGAALLGTSAARLEPAAPFVAAIVAVVDLFQSTALGATGRLDMESARRRSSCLWRRLSPHPHAFAEQPTRRGGLSKSATVLGFR